MDLDDLQREHHEWLARNFPGQPPHAALLGLTEEVGELAEAELASVWRPVVGHEDFYEVSAAGQVKRIGAGRGARVGHILAGRPDGGGYPVVNLYAGSTKSKVARHVHSLVAEAFIGPRPVGYEVNHRDLNPMNPALSNLEYVTHSENLEHAFRTRRQTVDQHNAANSTLGDLVRAVGQLSHAHLKGEQGIREMGDAVKCAAAKMDAVGDIVIYLASYCTTNQIDLAVAVQSAWDEVKARDWVTHPTDGRTH